MNRRPDQQLDDDDDEDPAEGTDPSARIFAVWGPGWRPLETQMTGKDITQTPTATKEPRWKTA